MYSPLGFRLRFGMACSSIPSRPSGFCPHHQPPGGISWSGDETHFPICRLYMSVSSLLCPPSCLSRVVAYLRQCSFRATCFEDSCPSILCWQRNLLSSLSCGQDLDFAEHQLPCIPCQVFHVRRCEVFGFDRFQYCNHY